MSTVTKKDLVQSISDKLNANPALVKGIVQSILDEVVEQLGQRNRIEFRDFAVFDIRIRPARVGHNPRTLEKVHVPARAVVEFKMGKRMREAVAQLDPQTMQPKDTPEEVPEAPAAPSLPPVTPPPPPPGQVP